MTKHTPGPWERDGTDIFTKEDECLAICGGGPNEKQDVANATLMAAAPELLEALKGLLGKGAWRDGTMDHMPVVKAARLAINKATGKA